MKLVSYEKISKLIVASFIAFTLGFCIVVSSSYADKQIDLMNEAEMSKNAVETVVRERVKITEEIVQGKKSLE